MYLSVLVSEEKALSWKILINGNNNNNNIDNIESRKNFFKYVYYKIYKYIFCYCTTNPAREYNYILVIYNNGT